MQILHAFLQRAPARHFPQTQAMDLDWNDIPLLLTLAASGNMSETGRALGMDTSTVSRRVQAAEKALKVRLFIREPGGYVPTDAGRVFLARAESVVSDVRSMLLDTRAEAEGLAGPVRLTAIDALFNHWLVPLLPELLRVHPDLRLQLLAANNDLSFTRREADLAIRMARPKQDAALLMRKVGELGFAVYGAPALAGTAREQWRDACWLAYGDELARVPEMQWLQRLQPSRIIQFSSAATMVHACEAGLGLALLPCIIGDRAGLSRMSQAPELHRDMWLLSHRDAGSIARFRVVADWLRERFAADAAAFRGDVPQSPSAPAAPQPLGARTRRSTQNG